MNRLILIIILFSLILFGCNVKQETVYKPETDSLRFEGEKHLRNIKQLTFGGNNAEAYWSFDNKQLVFQSDWNEINSQGCDQIFIMNADGTDLRAGEKYRMISTGTGRTTCAYFLKDGRIIWISEKSGYKHLWISKHSGSMSWPITQGQWEVTKIIHIDEDKEVVYFKGNKESIFESRFYSIRYDGTDLKLLTPEEGSHSISLLGSKLYFLDTFSSLQTPKTIQLKELGAGNLIRIIDKTDKSQFEEYEWETPKIIQFSSLDSSSILDGLLLLPKNYNPDKKYPLIVHGYGMPGTQIVWNKWGSVWSQYLSQQGYVVFSMDSRGMSGRGEKFKNLSYGDMSKYLALDNAAGVKQLIKLGYVDPQRVGAWGWSGGGYFTCLMVTRNSKYFKTGVAIAPCTDFRLYDTAYTERYMGSLETNKSGYDSTNVLSWIHRMKGSLLLMHGSNDDNVHLQHTSKFVSHALSLGKDVEWYSYPNKNHGIYGGGSRKHLYQKMIDYFNRNL